MNSLQPFRERLKRRGDRIIVFYLFRRSPLVLREDPARLYQISRHAPFDMRKDMLSLFSFSEFRRIDRRRLPPRKRGIRKGLREVPYHSAFQERTFPRAPTRTPSRLRSFSPFSFRTGKLSSAPVRCALHSPDHGHAPHEGAPFGTHTIAPSSMSASQKSPASFGYARLKISVNFAFVAGSSILLPSANSGS